MITLNIANHPKSLCENCHHSIIAKKDDITLISYCGATYDVPIPLPEIVSKCSRFDFKWDNAPTYMSERAWILEVKKGTIVGFRAPKKDKVEHD